MGPGDEEELANNGEELAETEANLAALNKNLAELNANMKIRKDELDDLERTSNEMTRKLNSAS